MLFDLFKYFFKLGFIAFGGPAAHVAIMEDDLVQKKKWLTSQEFLDYLGATNLIPGPNSTEMTMHVGYHRGGVAGVFVAGLSFIIPAVTLTVLVAVLFEKYSDIEWLIPIINGVKAAVISFIFAAIFKLGKKAIKDTFLLIIAVIALVLCLYGLNEILVILGAGLITMLIRTQIMNKYANSLFILPLFGMMEVGVTNLKLFLIFLKIGAVLFGSGYVLFAYLDGELISNLGWLTHPDLVEAIAVGQITPGPVLSTASFIGYKLGGFGGAILATLGIFLPSFIYVIILQNLLEKMKKNKYLQTFLLGVNVAAVAAMAAVSWEMTRSIVIDWKTGLICALSFFVYFYWKGINALWIILGGAVAAFALSFISL